MSAPAFDLDLMFRVAGDGDVSAAPDVTVLKFRQTPVSGQAVRISIPAGGAGTATLDVSLGLGPVGGTYDVQVITKEQVTIPVEGLEMIIPFATTEFEAELTLDPTATNAGAIEAGIVNWAHDEFTRDVDWS